MPEAPTTVLRRRLRDAAGLCALALLAGGGGPATAGDGSDSGKACAERGRRLLAQYRCGSCHAIPGVADARGVSASPLDGFARRSYIAGRIPNQPAALRAWIVESRALVPTTTMPSLGVSPAQASDIAAYLLSLR